jgi:hypothetical protein
MVRGMTAACSGVGASVPPCRPTPWPPACLNAPLQVQIIAIANSIDLTERALPALRQRGLLPQLVTFRAYTAAQVRPSLCSHPAYGGSHPVACRRRSLRVPAHAGGHPLHGPPRGSDLLLSLLPGWAAYPCRLWPS